jgi:hypothetical protein
MDDSGRLPKLGRSSRLMATSALALLDGRRCTVMERHVSTQVAKVIFPRSGSNHSQ